MFSPKINKIFVNTNSVNSKIFEYTRLANPNASISEIKTNTRVLDPSYNLISLSWKERARQKNHTISILNRNSSWNIDYNGRSTDFLPSNMIQSGCEYMCAYCWLNRHGPTYIKLYDDCYKFIDFCVDVETNIDKYREKFKEITKKDLEKYRDNRHNDFITIDIGCDDQITLSNRVTKSENYNGHIVDIVNSVNEQTKTIMLSFASKDADFTDYAPFIKNPERNRIRISLMPEDHRKILELNTSKIEDRLKSINYLVDMGFEVHVNLSPIVITDDFIEQYSDLLSKLNDSLSDKAKKQMAYEIIFVTHDNVVNENMSKYMPKAYEMITDGPCSLEKKWNKKNVFSYSRRDKTNLKEEVLKMIREFTPYARIRYMF